ncbi:MAG: glycosyltransferase family 1 protein, partial [Bacteroidota bacterium]
MRITIVTDGLYPWVTGGMQMHSYYLVKYLSENNTIDVYHINPEKKLIDLKFFFPDKVLVKINFIELPFLDNGFLPGHYVRANFIYSKLVLNEILK